MVELWQLTNCGRVANLRRFDLDSDPAFQSDLDLNQSFTTFLRQFMNLKKTHFKFMIILFRHHFDFRMFGISSLGWGKLTLKYSEDLDPDRRKKINISRKKDGIQIRPKDSEPSDSDAWSTWEHPFLILYQDQHPDLITIHLGTPQSPHKPLGETPISSWSIWGHPNLIMIHVGTHLSHHSPLGDTTISWSMHVETPPISSWSTYGHPNLIMIRLCRDTLILWWSCGGHPNLLMILWRTP